MPNPTLPRSLATVLLLAFFAAVACNGAEGGQSSAEVQELRRRVENVRQAMATKAKTHDLSRLEKLAEGFEKAFRAKDVTRARFYADVIEKEAARVRPRVSEPWPAQASLPPRPRPSMMFSRQEWERLSRADSSRHREMRELVRRWAQDHVSQSFPARIDKSWDTTSGWKQKGNLLRTMAFCALLFDEPRYVECAKRWALVMARYPRIGLARDVVDLDLQDPAKGLALAYDWLYERFSPAERAEVAAQLARIGERTEAALKGELGGKPVYWAREYNGNHNHHGFNALLEVALALREAHPRSGTWVELAARNFRRVLELSANVRDGNWNEGVCYGTYGESDVLQALWLLGQNGIELPGGAEWLRTGALWYVHTTTPVGLSAGYSDTTGKWFSGPHHILAYLDRRFRDGYGRWLIESPLMANNGALGARVEAIPFEWVWYDPSVEARAPERSWRFFDDWGVMVGRTGWGTDDAYFSFKAGPFGGFERARRFLAGDALARNLSVAHEHPDAGSFELVDAGRYVISDTLYAGEKLTREHSTLLIDGRGMVGDQAHWPDPEYTLLWTEGLPEFVFAGEREGHLAASVRFERLYPPDLGVELCQRTVWWLPDRRLLIVDHVRTARPSRVSALFWNAVEPLRPSGASTRVGEDGFWSIDHLWPQGQEQRIQRRKLYKVGLAGSAFGVEVREGGASRERWRATLLRPSGVASAAGVEPIEKGLRVDLGQGAFEITDAGARYSAGGVTVAFP